MSIQFDKVSIRISELQTRVVTVAPWETPLLQAIYGEDAQVVGSEQVDREVPNANSEFQRLATRYGPRNAETPVVAAVYGKFGPGVAKLNSEINRACGIETAALESGVAPVSDELTDAQIDAISAQGDAAQTQIIPAIEPNPPLVSNNPAIEAGDELAGLV